MMENQLFSEARTFAILNIEDSDDDYAQNLRLLGLGGLGKVLVQRARNFEELQSALKERNWDLVLSVFEMPHFNVYDALHCVRSLQPLTPFIVLSESVGEEAAVQLLKNGVDDLMLKSNLDGLVRTIRRCEREYESLRRAADAQRDAQDAIRQREQMLAVVTHDIKNPLSSIELSAQLLGQLAKSRSDSEFRADVIAQANRILNASGKMKILLRDVLDQSAIEAGAFSIQAKTQSLDSVLAETLDINGGIAKSRSIALTLKNDAKERLFCFDRDRVAQVIANLLGNALKFTPVGGTVEVSVECRDERVVVAVRDNGPGFPEGTQDQIFRRFWKSNRDTKVPGTGLGLYIARGIVEAHGGEIGAENLHPGARFWFSLEAPHRVSGKSMDLPTVGRLSGLRVMLIEDDEDLREALDRSLLSENAEVTSFSSAEAALENLSQSGRTGSHRNAYPDVILVDYRMPTMGGGEFSNRLRDFPLAALREIPVILMTADSDIENISRALGIEDFLSKPPDLHQLVETVFQVASRDRPVR